jgi:membrane associated rhomboid family serine protease
MTDAAHNPDDYCYRHPDRLSFVLCEKCGRTICLECQTHVDGKVLCPDDARRSNVTMLPVNRRPQRIKTVRRRPAFLARFSDRTPIVTYVIGAISLVISILSLIPGDFGLYIQATLIYQARGFAPWQPITAPFINPSVLGLLFNTFAFVIFGRVFEPLVGRGRFIAVFFIGSFGGEAFELILRGYACAGLSIPTVAMAAAIFIIQRRMGRTDYFLLGILIFDIVINIVTNGQWQAIVGGVVVGALLGLIFGRTERIKEGRPQNTVLVILTLVFYGIAATGAFTLGGS